MLATIGFSMTCVSSPDEIAGQGRAAGAVDAQHDGDDLLVVVRFAQRFDDGGRAQDLPAERIAFALAGHDRADGVDDGDLLAAACAGDRVAAHHGLHQLEEAHRAGEIGVDLLLAVVLDVDERLGVVRVGQFLAQRIGVRDAIDQTQLLGLGGRDQAAVDHFLGLCNRKRASLYDRRDHVVVHAVDQRRHVLAHRIAELLARERLGGAFVVADVNEVGLDAEFAEQAFVERGLGVNARQHHDARLRHDDFIAGAGDEVIGRHGRFQLGVDLLAGLAKAGDRRAQLLDLAAADRRDSGC